MYVGLIVSMAAGVMLSTMPAGAVAKCDSNATTQCCAGVDTAILACNQKAGATKPEDNAIWGILMLVLNIMTAGVGILAVGGIVYGSILYASAGDKAEQTKKAIGVITNVVIGIAAYGLMYLILNFIVPGGIFT